MEVWMSFIVTGTAVRHIRGNYWGFPNLCRPIESSLNIVYIFLHIFDVTQQAIIASSVCVFRTTTESSRHLLTL